VASVLLTLVALGGLVWGVARVGEEARRGIGSRDRYAVHFLEIDCQPPAGVDRKTFLAEVRYLANYPELFQSLDPDLVPKLTAAFQAHPWVAKVQNVHVEPSGTVRVLVQYRQPMLAIRSDDGMRIVDGSGVLLPLGTERGDLPELLTTIPAPPSAGQVWSNDIVKRALELTELHHPRQLEKVSKGWRLTMPDGKALLLER
jgi:hypothetical protein